jgi:nucleoside-diphosphate-sugar epimerase
MGEKMKTVLVTGATGYIASWIVKLLLEEGHTVHAAVRNKENKEKTKHLDEIASKSKGELKYFESDLLNEGSYTKAMKDCEIVFHTASPFIMDSKNPQTEVIDPAVKGTRNVLSSVNEMETVKKVILTSSVAAIYGNAEDANDIPNKTFNEEMWNHSSTPDDGEYSYSKKQAEKEAWKLNEAQNRWKLVTINPSFVVGPALNPHANFESKKFIMQMGNGDLKMGAPDINLGMVDVRDVAKAHILAALNDQANGRYIVSENSYKLLEIGKHLRSEFGDKYPTPKSTTPKFLVWLVAPMLGVKRSFIKKNVGHDFHFDNSRGKSELGLKYTSSKKAVSDFFQQFIEHDLI